MKKYLSLKIIGLIILFACSLGGYLYSRQKIEYVYKPRKIKLASQYEIHPTTNIKMKELRHSTPIFSVPTSSNNPKVIGNTKDVTLGHNKLVVPNKIAVAKNKPTYVNINQQGKNIGWINVKALKSTNSYLLPYTYYSQFWPSKVDDACEIASLKTAMSAKGKGQNVSLLQMVARIPRTDDPNTGYTHNPYHYGSHATIFPKAMVNIAKSYGVHAKDITGASKGKMIYEVTHGNPVVCEGPYMAKKPYSDHDMVILGYRPGYFYIADPFARDIHQRKTTWASISRLMSQYEKSSRQQHALVIY